MTIEQERTLEALKIAIQMEIDGKEYYLKVSQGSGNELGRELLQALASEEDIHRQKFEEIYDAIRNKKAWPSTDFQPDEGKRLRTILTMLIEKTSSNIKAPTTEIDVVRTAISTEIETYNFYNNQATNATSEAERDFYQTLAAEEREHQLVLQDYFGYLVDPFAGKSRASTVRRWLRK